MDKYVTYLCAQFCVPKICYWSVMSVNNLTCIQLRASNRQGSYMVGHTGAYFTFSHSTQTSYLFIHKMLQLLRDFYCGPCNFFPMHIQNLRTIFHMGYTNSYHAIIFLFLSWGISTSSWNQTWNHSRLSLIYTGRKLWNIENSDDERNDGFASAWIVLELRAVSLVFAESPLCHLSKADQREYQCYTRIMSRLHHPSHSRVFHVGGPAHPTRPRSPTMKHLTHPACLTADNSTQRVQLCNAQCTAE